MGDSKKNEGHLSKVDVSHLKELIEELVTWVIDEDVAFHPSPAFHFCIDVRLNSKVKPLLDELQKCTPVSSTV